MSKWDVEGYLEQFDRWVSPSTSAEWRVAAMAFGVGLLDGIPSGFQPDPELGDGWGLARIPGASNGTETAVAVLRVDAVAGVIQCVSIATLREPIL